MSLETRLTGIERKLWINDAAFYEDALVEDAVLVFPETGPISRSVAVDAIRQENAEGRRWAEVGFSDVRTQKISPNVALLVYRAVARCEHETSAVTVLAIYVERSGDWKLAFHQQSSLPGV